MFVSDHLPHDLEPLMPERDELAAAESALRAHRASFAYAYAHAGGCHGDAAHPSHSATRAETGRLEERVRAARAASRARDGAAAER